MHASRLHKPTPSRVKVADLESFPQTIPIRNSNNSANSWQSSKRHKPFSIVPRVTPQSSLLFNHSSSSRSLLSLRRS
ncbi:hypothetical protein AQUCO_08300062v1 [Aquilegia coerulea]|uniref:Uncharacterized protein n=1 Tax=Aquilegia coerulea TaxID=218851 RepID=A0A2G5C732_AQUCA|nr:hypothetical protein AQUCO_08300062v1 [Aquilegia coerulea]